MMVNKIKRLLESGEFTTKELAERFDVSERAVKLWLSGEAFPRHPIYQHVCKVLKEIDDELA